MAVEATPAAAADASQWRVLRALCWKNWRMKQRESPLNRNRTRGGGQWLFPGLVTEIIAPLALLLLLIQWLCGYNVSTGADTMSPTSVEEAAIDIQQRKLLMQLALSSASSASSTLLMAALPMVLALSNQTLAVLDRNESRALLAYLDRYDPALVCVCV